MRGGRGVFMLGKLKREKGNGDNPSQGDKGGGGEGIN
jgi:hypothetical protein